MSPRATVRPNDTFQEEIIKTNGSDVLAAKLANVDYNYMAHVTPEDLVTLSEDTIDRNKAVALINRARLALGEEPISTRTANVTPTLPQTKAAPPAPQKRGKGKASLTQRLARYETVEFTRDLIAALDRETVEELVTNFLTDPMDRTSLGRRFVEALEILPDFNKPVIVKNLDKTFATPAIMTEHVIDVITDRSNIVGGMVWLGPSRRSRQQYYVYWYDEIVTKPAQPRDPFSRPGVSCEDGYAREFQVELYREDGQPAIPLDIQEVLCLAWDSGEFPRLRELVIAQLTTFRSANDLTNILPRARAMYLQILREENGPETLANMLKVNSGSQPLPPSRPVTSPPTSPLQKATYQIYIEEATGPITIGDQVTNTGNVPRALVGYVDKQGRFGDLARLIVQSLQTIREYEAILAYSGDPKEKTRCRRAMGEQARLIHSWCLELGISPASVEITDQLLQM